MKHMRKIYNELFSINIKHQKDIITNLQYNSLKNLKLIIQYIASKTLATEAEIVIEESKNCFKTVSLYLAIPTKIKKFTREELNFVTILSKIIKYI